MNKVICLCTLYFTGVIGEITTRPLNVAVDVGNETVIVCSSNISNAIIWIYTTNCNSGSGTPLTDSNCNLIEMSSHYRTEKPDEGTCNLRVFDAILSLAGCYVCTDGIAIPGRIYSAFLIIIDPIADITINSTDLIPGEDAVISTVVSYNESAILGLLPPLPPSFYWTLHSDATQNITSYQESTTSTSASTYIVVTAQVPNVSSYLCNLFFNSPNNIDPNWADNAPTYTKSWTTTTYAVSYSPENISISGYPTGCPYTEDAATTLKCSASGYPPPGYVWVELTKPDVILSEKDTLSIQTDGIYQCNASNTIRSEVKAISTVANISDCFLFPHSEPYPPSNCDLMCIVIIVIAIYFGLNLLFFIIFITPYGCSKNGRNTMNERFPWLKDMLPCLNGEGCKCSVWIFYFVILSIFVGLVFFPTIMIMASCCKKNKKGSQGNTHQNERGKNGRGAAGIQMTTSGTTPNQSPSRLSVTTNPPSSLHTTAHYPQDPPSRPYPHSSNQQLQPTYSQYSDPYPRNLRQTPSPALSAGVVYAELGVDNKPMSRRPIQPIQGDGDAYAAIALA